MQQKLLKRKELIKRIVIYASMTLAIGIIVSFIALFVLGYRFDIDNSRLEQYALLQFSSSPSGATVAIDGQILGSRTPNKSTVSAGKHQIAMSRTGYRSWNKTIEIKSGVLEWLNYALLVPEVLTVEPVANYESIHATLASPGGHYMLVQGRSDVPTFNLVDLSSNTIKTTELTIPVGSYTDSTTIGITHTFQIKKWDNGGRYVLVNHTYGDKGEWLVLDTQDVNLTKNITQLFDFAISSIDFYGTSGNIFYALGSNDIRKLDLSAGTISRPLVSNVTSFNINNSGVIAYIGNGSVGTNQQVVGLYREGDDKSYTLRTVSSDVPVNIVADRYFNEDYVVISEGKKIDVLGGVYPSTANDIATSLKLLKSLTVDENVRNLSFSPTSEYVFVQSGAYFASYDLEYQSLVSTTIEGTSDTPLFKWLNDNYIWSDRDGNLTVREFDGTNIHTINSVLVGQDVTMTSNGRYLYSFNKSGVGYQLQRVRMVLP